MVCFSGGLGRELRERSLSRRGGDGEGVGFSSGDFSGRVGGSGRGSGPYDRKTALWGWHGVIIWV